MSAARRKPGLSPAPAEVTDDDDLEPAHGVPPRVRHLRHLVWAMLLVWLGLALLAVVLIAVL